MRTLEAERKKQHRHITSQGWEGRDNESGTVVFLDPSMPSVCWLIRRNNDSLFAEWLQRKDTASKKLGPLTVELHANSSQVVCGEPILPSGRVPTEPPLLEGHVWTALVTCYFFEWLTTNLGSKRGISPANSRRERMPICAAWNNCFRPVKQVTRGVTGKRLPTVMFLSFN